MSTSGRMLPERVYFSFCGAQRSNLSPSKNRAPVRRNILARLIRSTCITGDL